MVGLTPKEFWVLSTVLGDDTLSVTGYFTEDVSDIAEELILQGRLKVIHTMLCLEGCPCGDWPGNDNYEHAGYETTELGKLAVRMRLHEMVGP